MHFFPLWTKHSALLLSPTEENPAGLQQETNTEKDGQINIKVDKSSKTSSSTSSRKSFLPEKVPNSRPTLATAAAASSGNRLAPSLGGSLGRMLESLQPVIFSRPAQSQAFQARCSRPAKQTRQVELTVFHFFKQWDCLVSDDVFNFISKGILVMLTLYAAVLSLTVLSKLLSFEINLNGKNVALFFKFSIYIYFADKFEQVFITMAVKQHQNHDEMTSRWLN